jgi:FkbM family methyltransferase
VRTDVTVIKRDNPAAELDALLSEPLNAAFERERNAFDEASAPLGERVVLYGAGRFGRRTLDCMRGIGLEPLAFADNNPDLDGKPLDGVPIYAASRAAVLYGKDATFLITVWNSSATDRMVHRIQQLKDLGCERVLPVGLLCWKHPEAFLPYYPLDLPHKVLTAANEVKAALNLFADEASRSEFVAQVRFRLLLDYEAISLTYATDHFQQNLFDLGNEEVLIDCGAFDGDTIAAFVRLRGHLFSSIVAFEPDPLNWAKLEFRISTFPDDIKRKITPLPYALGSSACMVQFNSTGTDVAKIGQGSTSVKRLTLDQTLRDYTPTFIKFDIEGAEMDALMGAREVVARSRPVLAVSCYHEQSHLWDIPLQLASLCRDYHFFLRPQGVEGWDLLCYAIPVERLKIL